MTELGTIISSILSKMAEISKPRRKFILHCMLLYMSIRGRINFLQLARHSDLYVESSYRNHFDTYFDFSSFNTALLLSHGSGHYVLALDMTYIRKSGKHTEGLGHYWSGCSGRQEWGLEAGILAAIDIDHHTALSIDAIQSPNLSQRQNQGFSYIDHCVSVVVWNQANIAKLSNYLVVDAYFTKKDFILPVLARTGLQLVGRLRTDANLRYLYKGEQKPGRGRPKKYAGKVDWEHIDEHQFKVVYQDEQVRIYDAVLHCVFLGRLIRVAYVVYLNKKGKEKTNIYFSTDIHLPACQIKRYYQARFQQEFLIRDAKQFTGLQDCQARSLQKTEFHWNMALTAVNLAKVKYWLQVPKEQRKAFSMNNVKVLCYNQLLLDRFFQILPNKDELIKNKPEILKLYKYGTIAA